MNISFNQYRASLLLWSGILVLVACVWSFQLTSFMHTKSAALAAGVAIAVIMQARGGASLSAGFRCYLPLWFGLVVWTISGFFTARVLSFHIERTLYLSLVLLAASLAIDPFRRTGGRSWLLHILLLSGVFVGLLALLQYAGAIEFMFPVFPGYAQRAYSVFGNQNLLGGYMAVNLALLIAMLTRARRLSRSSMLMFTGVLAVLLGALLISQTRTAWLAAAAGCAWAIVTSGLLRRPAAVMTRWRRNGLWLTPIVAVALIAVTAPLLVTRLSGTFAEHDVGGRSRVWFWAGAVRMIADAPLFGVAPGNYAYWSPLYQGDALHAPGGERLFHNELHTIHAHSEPLEWLAETGIVGSLFVAWFVIAALRRAGFGAPGLIALFVFAWFNTIVHSPPHLLAGLLLAGASVPAAAAASEKPRVAPHLITAATATILLLFVFTTLVPSVLLSRAEQAHIAGGRPESLYLRALRWPWPNPQAHESYAVALLDGGRFTEARVQLEQALEGLDTGRIHLLLAICAEAAGDDRQALHHARECLYRWPANEYAKTLATRPRALDKAYTPGPDQNR